MQNIIDTLLSQDIVQALVYTLLHSLWQAPLIALIMYIGLRVVPASLPRKRHNVAMASIMLLCSASVFTLLYYIVQGSSWVVSAPVLAESSSIMSNAVGAAMSPSNGALAASGAEQSWHIMDWVSTHQYRIALTWIVGVLLFGGRILLGGWHMHYVCKSVSFDINPDIAISLHELKTKLGINKVVEIGVSTLVKTPMMMGHLRPIIVLPIAAINQLSIEEVESIIAHELGHVLRNDFISNIFILMAESFYFFNPAIWWMCSVIRAERENASDDIALRLGIDRYSYVKTLVRLEEIQMPASTRLALRMAGSKRSLLIRVKRIMSQPIQQSYLWERGTAMGLLLLSLASVAVASQSVKNEAIQSNESAILLDVLPVASDMDNTTLYAYGHKDAPSVNMQVEKGNLKAILVDDQEVSPSDYDTITKAMGLLADNNLVSNEAKVLRSINVKKMGDDTYTIEVDTIDDEIRAQLKAMAKNAKEMSKVLAREMKEMSRQMKEELKSQRLSEDEREEIMSELDEAMEDAREELEEAMQESSDARIEMEEAMEEMNSEMQEAMEEMMEESAEMTTIINEEMVEMTEEITESMSEFGVELGSEMAEMGIAIAEEISSLFTNERRSSRSSANKLRRGRQVNNSEKLKRELVDQMVADGLWQNEKNKIIIDSTKLVINRVDQSTAQYDKYYQIVSKHLPEVKDTTMRLSLIVVGRSLEDAEDVRLSLSIEDNN